MVGFDLIKPTACVMVLTHHEGLGGFISYGVLFIV